MTHDQPSDSEVRRLHQVFEISCDRRPDALAVDCLGLRLTYRDLDVRANQLANHLRAAGVGSWTRVAILLERSVHTYVALLAVGKASATFVPIDPAAPRDRVEYIVSDAEADVVLTTADFRDAVSGLPCRVVELDTDAERIDAAAPTRPLLEHNEPDPLAYVMYTSGSSGRPKGVMIAQSSIRNFLDVVPVVYDIRCGDRVYQGMTISFDFSIEEIWPTWAMGATVVTGPTDSRRLGGELADFLDEQEVSVLFCVPTLLATIPRDLPSLRSILVGGEACPAQLVQRWAKPGRMMLNTYGPTEATVTATVGELLPDRPVTIGKALPTYTVVLLDERRRPVPDGETGEICIGGPGVARGYVGRPELTEQKFVEHPLAPAGGLLYRTGDLGRLVPGGEIEYQGRADAEVKIRGHRVDLGEIESVLMEDEDVAEAVVATTSVGGAGGEQDLAAYVVTGRGFARADRADVDALAQRLHGRMRDRLPQYMVAAYIDVLDSLPTMPSGKVDRRLLPAPSRPRISCAGPVIAPSTQLEREIAAVCADVFGLPADSVSVEAHFFTDLGGHSMLAARVVSELRAAEIIPQMGLRDLYEHPTIRSLAARFQGAAAHLPPPCALAGVTPRRARSSEVFAAGTAQLGVLYLLTLVTTLPIVYFLFDDSTNWPELVGQLAIVYLGARWVLPPIGIRLACLGVKPGRYRLWGPTHLRIWTADLFMAMSPASVFAGSPLAAAYLRLLGARVGRDAHVNAAVSLPSLVRIGRDASIGYGVSLRPWRVESGWVIVEPITLEDNAFVGTRAVLEPGSTVCEGGALGEQSLLGQGLTVPAGQRWAGSPGEPVEHLSAEVDGLLGAPQAAGRWTIGHRAVAGAGIALVEIVGLASLVPAASLDWWVSADAGMLTGLFASIAVGPVFVLSVCALVALGKRAVLPTLPAGMQQARSWLGIRKWFADKLLGYSLLATNALYATLYTVPWLRVLGARIGAGSEVSTVGHIDPGLLVLGRDSFVADMASIGAASFARGWMVCAPTVVGERSFVGNAAVVSAGTEIGDNALVGVGTIPPADGVPAGTSWLGSPAMFLPARQSSGTFGESTTFRPPRRAVVLRFVIEFFRISVPPSLLALGIYGYVWSMLVIARDAGSLLLSAVASPVLSAVSGLLVVGVCAVIKRLVVGTYVPRRKPLWDLFVRRSEFVTALYETAAVPALLGMLVGTPLLPPLLRWFGVHVGRRTWIGTTYITEFDLVTIGDDAAIGAQVSLQTHLFEDRVMKMSVVEVGAGATVGARSIVLYDAVVDSDVVLGPLSLVMKGERLADSTRWRGLPALPEAYLGAEIDAVLGAVESGAETGRGAPAAPSSGRHRGEVAPGIGAADGSVTS